jgi:hypothetical protein
MVQKLKRTGKYISGVSAQDLQCMMTNHRTAQCIIDMVRAAWCTDDTIDESWYVGLTSCLPKSFREQNADPESASARERVVVSGLGLHQSFRQHLSKNAVEVPAEAWSFADQLVAVCKKLYKRFSMDGVCHGGRM